MFFLSLIGLDPAQRAAFFSFVVPYFEEAKLLSPLLREPCRSDLGGTVPPLRVPGAVGALLESYLAAFCTVPFTPCTTEAVG